MYCKHYKFIIDYNFLSYHKEFLIKKRTVSIAKFFTLFPSIIEKEFIFHGMFKALASIKF